MILLNGKEVEFSTFPNGETHFKNAGLKVDSMNMVSFKYTNDSDLVKLMFLKNYLDHYSIRNTLIIYYMPYSRMDRSEGGSPFTLKYVANFINSLKFNSIQVIEPHSDVTCAVLDNATPNYINYNLLFDVMKQVRFEPNHDSIVFPDSGAQKRYSNLKFKHTLIGNKKRDFETGRITSLDIIGEVGKIGNKAIIVDDLSSYGGTFIMTAETLRKKGFEEVYLLVAHAEDSIFKGKLFTSGLIDKVFTTDTIIDEKSFIVIGDSIKEVQKELDKIKIYKIEEILTNWSDV